jgi:ribosomal protein S18 acetylase RimI-like enzyme
MSNEIVVRPCRLGDVREVARMLKVSWHRVYDPILGVKRATRHGKWLYSPSILFLLLLLNAKHHQFTAVQNGELIGYAMVYPEAEGGILLAALYVHPDKFGQGAGSALLANAMLLNKAAKSIRVETLEANTNAVGWYLSKGFEIYHRRPFASGLADVPSCLLDRLIKPL